MKEEEVYNHEVQTILGIVNNDSVKIKDS